MSGLLLIVPDNKYIADMAINLWQPLCSELGCTLEILNITNPKTRELMLTVGLSTYPALLVGKIVKAVGIPDMDRARQLLKKEKEICKKTG